MNYLEKLKLKISLPQELSLLPKVENSKKEPTSHTALTAKSTLGTLDSTRGGHILPFDLPEKSIQQQHNTLWLQADELADWIDDSNSTLPWRERAAKVPELQAMSLELSRLEQLGAIPPGTKPVINTAKKQAQSFLPGFSPLKIPKIEQASPDACSAKCKRTGKCYGKAYFDAKPGKAIDCVPNQCPWNDQSEQYLERDLK